MNLEQLSVGTQSTPFHFITVVGTRRVVSTHNLYLCRKCCLLSKLISLSMHGSDQFRYCNNDKLLQFSSNIKVLLCLYLLSYDYWEKLLSQPQVLVYAVYGDHWISV